MRPQALRSGHGTAGSITVHSMGGLGNQLFIYAAGLAAARSSGSRLAVDASLHLRDSDRPFLLSSLGLPADYVDLGLGHSGNPVQRRIFGAPYNCSYAESSYRFDQSVLTQREGACLYGYFQGRQYVEYVATELREMLQSIRDIRRNNPEYKHARARIEEPGAIVLHVRRGDYLREHALRFHGVAPLDFYRRAVDVLRRMGFDGPLVLFTDEVHRVLDEFAPLGEVLAPSALGTLDDLDDLLLMSEAQALITANSSFSWWAAWIDTALERPVICPRPWFDDPSMDDRDLLAPSWLTLMR